MSEIERTSASEEAVVWEGRPSWRAIARDVFHIRGLTAYLAFLVLLDAWEAWSKAIPLGKALHDSLPLAIIIVGLVAYVAGYAYLMSRTTRYTVTTRRVLLAYGVAIPATLSIPHNRIRKIELSYARNGVGDIALALAADDHMPYLKLWPLARPWRIKEPQPMLRGVRQAAVVAGLLTRAVATTANQRHALTVTQKARGAELEQAGVAA